MSNKLTNMTPKFNQSEQAQFACKNCKHAGRLYSNKTMNPKPCNHCKSEVHYPKDSPMYYTGSKKQL